MTILCEIGDIQRFPTVKNFLSYCRLVKGTVASAGSSTGPHLHFEVRALVNSSVWIDPYAGPYSQPESLWTDQRPYVDTAMLLIATGDAAPVYNRCAPDAPCCHSVTIWPASRTGHSTIDA